MIWPIQLSKVSARLPIQGSYAQADQYINRLFLCHVSSPHCVYDVQALEPTLDSIIPPDLTVRGLGLLHPPAALRLRPFCPLPP